MNYSKCTANGFIDCDYECEKCGFSKTESARRKAKIKKDGLVNVCYIYADGTRRKLKTLFV